MAAEEMEALASRYADRAVRSAFIYTREAHPGENYRHHSSMDDKRANARAFQEHSSIKRQILIDDLEGTAHHGYGVVPNMTWIIGRGGFILYKAAWTSAGDVESGLLQALDFQENRAQNKWVPFYSERAAYSARVMARFREGLERAGPQAVSHFGGRGAAPAGGKPGPDAIPVIPGNFYKPE